MRLPFITRTQLDLILRREMERIESEIRIQRGEIYEIKDAIRKISYATNKV